MNEEMELSEHSPEQLVALIQQGHPMYFEELFCRFLPLVKKFNKAYYLRSLEQEDFWQEARMVLLPLAMGGFASTGLLCLVLSWNEAFWSLNLSAAKAGTLATLIASYSSPEGLFWAKLSAASPMAIAPIVVFGWFSQKQLVQGLTFGAVK